MSTEKVAFIGLGVMGYPMAGHLSGASLDVAVYNRTDSRAQAWLQSFSGKKAATPAELLQMQTLFVFVWVTMMMCDR